jgi:hypothetical protein
MPPTSPAITVLGGAKYWRASVSVSRFGSCHRHGSGSDVAHHPRAAPASRAQRATRAWTPPLLALLCSRAAAALLLSGEGRRAASSAPSAEAEAEAVAAYSHWDVIYVKLNSH